jgi:hypothetical protein
MLDISGGARGPHGLSVAGSPSHLIETAKAFGAAAFAHYDERIGPEARIELLQAAEALLGYQQEDGSVKEGYVLLPIAAGRTQATMQAAQAFRQAHARTADERWLPPLRKAEAYAEGPKSVFWNGRAAHGEPAPRGMYVAEVRVLDAGGKALETERVSFLNDTPEAQRAQFAEVEGQLLLDGAAPAANTKIELVDDAGNVVQSAVTTRAGQYRFKNVDKGAYRVRVQKRGFAGDEVRVQAAPASAPAKADVYLRME